MKYDYQYWKTRENSADRIQRVGLRLSVLMAYMSFVGWLSVTVTATSQHPLLAAIIFPPCVIGIGVVVVFGVVSVMIMLLEWVFDVPYHKRIIH